LIKIEYIWKKKIDYIRANLIRFELNLGKSKSKFSKSQQILANLRQNWAKMIRFGQNLASPKTPDLLCLWTQLQLNTHPWNMCNWFTSLLDLRFKTSRVNCLMYATKSTITNRCNISFINLPFKPFCVAVLILVCVWCYKASCMGFLSAL